MKRRNFLMSASAILGSTILAACGGGGSDPTKPNATTPNAGGAAVPASAASGATVPASPSQAATGAPSTPAQSNTDGSPANPTQATKRIFYGMNGHYDYTYSPDQVISMLTAIGCTTYRLAVEDFGNSLTAVTNMAKAFQNTGMTLFVCIDPNVVDANGKLWASEQAAYNEGYNWGSTAAKALSPYGVTMYECGNELTRRPQIIVDSTTAGNKASDFNNANWPIMRGLMLGMMAGVKAIQPSAKCGINFCVADIGASDALWNGMQPDGSSGHPVVKWDITTWHNYQVYGDIFNIGTDGAGPGFDLPAYCKAKYGVPFMLTEWNANPEVTQDARAAYITQKMTSYYANRKADNIDSIMYYDLDSGNTQWGLVINGVPNTLPYNAMKNFIASNPDS
jgi:hypothetical protein